MPVWHSRPRLWLIIRVVDRRRPRLRTINPTRYTKEEKLVDTGPITRSPDHPITRSRRLTHLQKAVFRSGSALNNRTKAILPGPSARKKAHPPDAAFRP